jgi:hypothetical protein
VSQITLTPTFYSHLLAALICSRLLASTMDRDISERAYALLKEARRVAHRWIDEVGIKLGSTQHEPSRAGLRYRLCMLAATCFSTFDVCSEHVPAVLAIDEDFAIAMQCAAIVHDNKPPSLSDDDSHYLTRMLSRHLRLLHNLEPIFRQEQSEFKLSHARAYDDACSRLWPGYRPRNSASWNALPAPNSRWLSSITEAGQDVHYNLLTGELLIGGKRLGTLPQEIVKHPTYENIFGAVSGQHGSSHALSDYS